MRRSEVGSVPQVVAETTAMLASNAAHLARLLKQHSYPGIA